MPYAHAGTINDERVRKTWSCSPNKFFFCFREKNIRFFYNETHVVFRFYLFVDDYKLHVLAERVDAGEKKKLFFIYYCQHALCFLGKSKNILIEWNFLWINFRLFWKYHD